MYRTYKARIYPNKTQLNLIHQTFGCVRFVWNHMLNRGKKMYQRRGENLDRFGMNYVLTELKEIYPWLRDVDSTALTSVSDYLYNAKRDFFKKKKGYPKFKTKKNPVKGYTSKSSAIHYEDGYLTLPKIGKLRLHNKELPPDGCKIKRVTVTVNAAMEYYVSMLTETEPSVLPETGKQVGIDLGVERFLVDSYGNKVENPKFFDKAKTKLAKEQRKLSKKEQGSRNYEKQKIKTAKRHLKVSRQREHFHNCLVKTLVTENDVICAEKLSVKKMFVEKSDLPQKVKRDINRNIADSGWSLFAGKLAQKSEMTGRCFIQASPYFPSSQLCSQCGEQNPAVKDLRIRKWICPTCGAEHDRDVNAAINILNEGLRMV